MGNLNVNIPSINTSFYNESAASMNKKKIIDVIRPKYGSIINNISNVTNVPSEIIESFMFIESGGNEKAETPYAIGLMQVGKSAASDTIVKEKGAGRLRNEEAAILKKYLPASTWKEIEGVKPKQKSLGKTFVTRDMLLKPEFNILVGSMLIGQLMDEFSVGDKPRLDKVVVVYNRGRFDSVSKKVIDFSGTTEQMKSIIPDSTYDYIEKLLGVNGTLDVIV